MKRFNAVRTLVTSGAIILIIAVTSIVFAVGGIWFGAATFILLMEEFIRRSAYYVPAIPPTKAVPMVWGKFINVLLDAGWHFIPVYGSPLMDVREITGEEIAIRFTETVVMPGDRSEVKVPVSVYVAVDPQNPVQVFIVGGLEEVVRRIEEQVVEALRHWLVNARRDPQTMDDARRMNDEAINEILNGLFRHDVMRINHEIPSEVVIRYFGGMRVLSPQEKEWETALLNLTDNERRAIRESAQDRFNLIQSMRNGNQSYPLHGLGMVVRQMVVGNVEPTGETKKAVDKVAAARFNAEEQGIRRDSVKDEAAIYAEIPGVKDPLDQTFIRRGITTKDTRVTRVETSDELTAVLKGLAGLLIAGKGK